MKVSITEFANQQKVEYAVAAGFVKFLEAKSLAKVIEKRSSGKGKPTNIYEFDDSLVPGRQISAA